MINNWQSHVKKSHIFLGRIDGSNREALVKTRVAASFGDRRKPATVLGVITPDPMGIYELPGQSKFQSHSCLSLLPPSHAMGCSDYGHASSATLMHELCHKEGIDEEDSCT